MCIQIPSLIDRCAKVPEILFLAQVSENMIIAVKSCFSNYFEDLRVKNARAVRFSFFEPVLGSCLQSLRLFLR